MCKNVCNVTTMASDVVVKDNDSSCLNCPITLDVMTDPVIDAKGYTFDRAAIEAALREKPGVCPLTNERYPGGEARLMSNRAVKHIIDEYQEKKGEAPLASASEFRELRDLIFCNVQRSSWVVR